MKSNRARTSIVILVIVSGALLDGAYAIGALRSFFDPFATVARREALVPVIALDLGWVALLLWAACKPFERRAILLVSVLPILLGNILTGANQLQAAPGSTAQVATNTLIGLLYAGLYMAAYLIGKPGK